MRSLRANRALRRRSPAPRASRHVERGDPAGASALGAALEEARGHEHESGDLRVVDVAVGAEGLAGAAEERRAVDVHDRLPRDPGELGIKEVDLGGAHAAGARRGRR